MPITSVRAMFDSDEADVAEQRRVERGRSARRGRRRVAAAISRNTYGWQRIAPWPKMIRLRVRMFAPSTVIDDRQLHVRGAEEVRRAHADALAADDVHAVVDDLARALGQMVLGDGRQHRGLLAEIDAPAR